MESKNRPKEQSANNRSGRDCGLELDLGKEIDGGLQTCDRRNSAYCNKRYGRPATRCRVVEKSVGAQAIGARGEGVSESRSHDNSGSVAEALLLSLRLGVVSERHALGGREVFLARGCRTCATM